MSRHLIVVEQDFFFFLSDQGRRSEVSLRLSLMKDGRQEDASKEFCAPNDSSGYVGLKPRSFCGSTSSTVKFALRTSILAP